MHFPFSFLDNTKSATYFGSGEHGLFQISYLCDMPLKTRLCREIIYLEPFDHDEEPHHDYNIKVATTVHHFSKTMNEIIQTISPV